MTYSTVVNLVFGKTTLLLLHLFTFLDLSKAFDTIDHQILFGKLERYGIRGLALDWIKSFFSCRQQFVQFNSTCSSKQTIKCGVPQLQGSILGRLLFTLYY